MNILSEIFAYERFEIEGRKKAKSMVEIRAEAEAASMPPDFVQALGASRYTSARPVLIAEVKFASPSMGLFIKEPDPIGLAEKYEQAGAAAISVLTNKKYFHGCIDYLRDIHCAFPAMPLLRKDFMFDPYHLYEARAAGASAVLLIASCLGPSRLADLHALAAELGMAALVEVHDRVELKMVMKVPGLVLLGVNNRDLRTFKVDLQTCLDMRALVPSSIYYVAESGIHSREDVRRLADADVDAMLVGESLVTAVNVQQAIYNLKG